MKKELRSDIPLKEVIQAYKKEKDGRLKERLLAIKLLLEGKTVPQIADELEVSLKTIYNWINHWNDQGYEGLKPKHRKSGRKGYLSRDEWQEIFQELQGKNYSIDEIIDYIQTTRGKCYGYKAIWRVLRKYTPFKQ